MLEHEIIGYCQWCSSIRSHATLTKIYCHAESCSNKNKYISVVLQALYRDGIFRAPGFEKIDVPDQYNEKQLMRNTLELVEVVLSDEEHTDCFYE
jgi:hypothetical protein